MRNIQCRSLKSLNFKGYPIQLPGLSINSLKLFNKFITTIRLIDMTVEFRYMLENYPKLVSASL